MKNYSDIQKILLPYFEDLETENIHWIRGYDEGLNFCHRCAKAKAKYIRRHEKHEHENWREITVDGGWDSSCLEDGSSFCEICHKPLNYSLTEHGVTEEAWHFLNYGVDGFDEYPVTAHELYEIFESGQHYEECYEDLDKLEAMVREYLSKLGAQGRR